MRSVVLSSTFRLAIGTLKECFVVHVSLASALQMQRAPSFVSQFPGLSPITLENLWDIDLGSIFRSSKETEQCEISETRFQCFMSQTEWLRFAVIYRRVVSLPNMDIC